MAIRVTFLGTGTSAGVPMLCCDRRACASLDPRDKRMRASILVEWPGSAEADEQPQRDRAILIDTTPELRIQALMAGVEHVDAVLFTHAHADHCLGLDDIRRFLDHQGNAAMPMYVESEPLATIASFFSYAIDNGHRRTPGRPLVTPILIEPGKPFELFGREILPLRLMHGRLPVVGFRIESFAYCTDVNLIPDDTWPLLEGLDLLVLDALRYAGHPTHFSVPQALEVIEKLKPRRTFFTHIDHELIHAEMEQKLPPGVRLAYDGLVVST